MSSSLPPVASKLQDALRSTYQLERELGGGAMSRVFVATETALGRRVVVKVLPTELAEGLNSERFRREILVAARLQHPNIVPVLAAGDAAGLPYYTMPFVAGESLRTRLSARGRVPFRDAMAVLRDVARALAYAHHEGVVHRDIKPENVLIHAPTPGSGAPEIAVVADFGIARALSAAMQPASTGTGDSGRLTQLGMTLGTPTYMAPEQAVGEEIDHRADIYAFGVMAYELVLGAPPFIESSAQRLMVAHLTKQPTPLAERVPELPRGFSDLVMRCLGKEPDERPQSMVEILDALDAVDSGAMPTLPIRTVRDHAGPSVAVLPFANLSPDPDTEYFSDGVTEEVLNALTQVPGLRVAARTSAFAFKGRQLPLGEIADQLNVRTILEGSVRRAGNRVRIGVQLVSAADGLHLWAERYDRELSDVFALQDEIASSIALALGEKLTSGESMAPGRGAQPAPGWPEGHGAHHARHGALNLEAYEQYLRGRFLFEQHDHRIVEGLQCLEAARTIDPEFALAHAWTGIVYAMMGAYRVMPSDQAFQMSRACTERALELSPHLAEALTGRAMVALWYEWDLAAAESLARGAVAAAPGLGVGHEWLGWTLLSAERFDEAIASMKLALEIDPIGSYTTVSTAFALNMAGRPEESLAILNEALRRTPNDAELHRLVGVSNLVAGRYAESAAALRRSRELNPKNPYVNGNLAQALALSGEVEEARAIADAMAEGARAGMVPYAMVALAFQALGESDAAFAWLEKSLAVREFWLVVAHVDPEFVRFRGDPRFNAIIRRVGVRGDSGSRPRPVPYPPPTGVER